MDGAVVQGPKRPFWGCQQCGLTSNWACRLRCRCSASAPQAVLKRVQQDPGVRGAPRGMCGGARPPAV
eukprot:7610431-Pyramimonas_sp.AAC.1